MPKKPKWLQLEEQILNLKEEQLNILIAQNKKILTGLQNELKRIDISDKQWPGFKDKPRIKDILVETRSGIEQMELKLEGLLSERDGIKARIERLDKFIKERR